MRVLFVSCDPLDGAVTRYRCTHLAEALKSQGHTADVATIYDPLIRLEHDIVVLHRICANQEGQALADAVRKSGATLIYGADDLVWEDGPLAHLHLAMLQQADGVLVSTEALEEYGEAAGGQSVVVLRNIAQDSEEPGNLSADLGLSLKCAMTKILYAAGTATHDGDLLQVVEPLRHCLTRYPDTLLVLMGPLSVPDIFPKAQVLRVPLQSWTNYLAVIKHCDIVIAPLDKTEFNRCKSEIKWQEAALCSRPTVASRWGGFAEVIEDGRDGLLAESSSEWIEKLEQLLAEDDGGHNPLRAELGSRAWARLQNLSSHEAQRTRHAFERWIPERGISAGVFSNPRGFAKGLAKKTLRRLKR